MDYLEKKFPSWQTEPIQMASSNVLMIPLYRFDMKPRTRLGGEATIRSVGKNEPILKTQFAAIVDSKFNSETTTIVPGRNVVMAHQHAAEHGGRLHREQGVRLHGVVQVAGYIDYPLPKDCGKIEPWNVLYEQD
ncbi:hypothetical protein TGAM01_v211140 [Trichoderma gamsii]|uniref:Uncharacterized protein n=1 Tax=Trichoderma gamsii TaxID=398673 RepID=A0A2P4Z6S9_9HYPO|nr:hypothetical protein TGAM01_v211140 [Trichoderma gamsii]PON19990.1 hypothetical protein TGAM01_v211140 [Trichoderma gamsii]